MIMTWAVSPSSILSFSQEVDRKNAQGTGSAASISPGDRLKFKFLAEWKPLEWDPLMCVLASL